LRVRRDDAGRVLSDTVRGYMSDLGVDNGLQAVGYSTNDIPALVQATLPQVRFLLPARRYASTDTSCCPVSVTSRCSIERDERISLVFGMGAFLTSRTLCFKEI